MDEDGSAKIYEDLPDFRYDKTLDQLSAIIAKLEAENHVLQSRLVEITEEKNVLEADCRNLNTNFSSLLKTAKLEIERKERAIVDLREQLNKVMPQKKQFGTKRRRETVSTPSPRKKPRFSPRKVPEIRKFSLRKVRDERVTSRIKDTEANSKPKIRELSNRPERATLGKRASRDERPTLVETHHPVNSKSKTQIDENGAASENVVVPSPAIAAPALPALQCPTVFSLRMYKRIYGREYESAVATSPANPSGSTNSVQQSADADPQKPPTTLRKHEESAEIPLKKLEVHVHQPPTVGPHSIPSIPPRSIQDVSSKLDLEQSSPKSPPAKIGLPAIGRPRQQMVAAVRPIRTLAVQRIPAVVEKSGQDKLVECTTKFPNENSPKSDTAEINSGARSAEKSSRHLRIPGLSGSTKGRTVRQVFAPISNQWNSSHPGASNLHDKNEKDCREMPVVETVSVTSELTVRVEDSTQDALKKQSSAEALFGSPVKWADDSLDSPITEGSDNSRRLYSIFGSPLKSFDSNSSEHPFSVPPAAYEDSCWTNQVPDKMLTNSSAGDANLQKQSQKIQEPPTEVKTKPKEKSINLNDAEKVATHSFFPPTSLSVIKKHVSIFSPVKDSKLSVTSNFPDEPSRSNTGICFPFAKSQYEDSVLGQFDDTAQFVSALSKVDTQISPLSTPIKCGEGSNQTRSVIVEKNPTSFQQVFNSNGPEGTQQIHESPNFVEDVVAVTSAETPSLPVLPKSLSNEEHAAGTFNQCALSRYSSNEDFEISNRNEIIDNAENLKPQKIVEPPTITITAPKTESSVRLIHRPNFASSTMLSVKSWFPDAPVKKVTPRKTPRLVSCVNRSSSPKGLDMSGARVAINDAFIIQQEERVRRWELDLYENTRSGSANESPTRKRMESPGKISPSKRSPRKQMSPCKSFRRAEVHKDLVVKPALLSASGAVTASASASNQDNTQNQLNLCSANHTASDPCSADAAFSQVLTEPIKSVPVTTQKVLTMIDAVTQKHKEPRFESSLIAEANESEEVAPRPVDVTNKGDEFRARDKDTVVEEISPEPPSGPTLKIVSSLVAESDHTSGAETGLKNASNEQASLAKPSDSSVSCNSPVRAPLLFNDKSGLFGTTLNISGNVPESSGICSANSRDASNVTHAEASKVPDHPKQLPEVKANRNKKQRRTIVSRNNYTACTPIVPSESTGSSECHSNIPNQATSNGEPTRKKFRNSSKYTAIISRVKPSTPLNRAVAALLSSSASSKSPSSSITRQTIAPIASTKKSAFKRSSALKSDSEKVTGNNLMNSVRSTFFQGTPTSSVKTGNSGAETQSPQSNIQPKLICRKSKPNLSVAFTNTVSVRSTAHNLVVAQSQQKHLTTTENVGSRAPATVGKDGVALSKTLAQDVAHSEAPLDPSNQDSEIISEKPTEIECNIPGQWKLLEVDHHAKPISLLQRFRESKEGLCHPLDLIPKEKSNTGTDGPKVETDTTPSASQSLGLNFPLERACQEKPDTELLPKPDGVKGLNRDSVKFPPKSPVFPRSSRKTILLNSPLKMKPPGKVKKHLGESIESPKPKEKCDESFKSKEECGDSKSGKKASAGRVSPENKSPKKPYRESRSRSTSGGIFAAGDSSLKESNKEARSGEVTPENTSPKESNNKHAELRRSRADSPGKSRSRNKSKYRRSRERSRDGRSRERSRDLRYRYRSRDHRSTKGFRNRRSRSHSISPRRSRLKNRDISPKPNKKGPSPCHSPEMSPVRKSSRSSDRKSETATKESARGKAKADSEESPERETTTVLSGSVGRRLKISTAESVAKRSKASSADSACVSSKIRSLESANENSKIIRPESLDDFPVVLITASAPRQTKVSVFLKNSVAPPADSNGAKVTSAEPRNSGTPQTVKLCSSPGITSSTPRVQAAATPSISGPALVIRRNRKPNFSSTSAAKQPEIVISAGERPALFSRSS